MSGTLRRRFRRRGSRVLCTAAVGPHLELLELSEPTFRAYADAHGYELVVARELVAPERPASWSKVKMVQALMARHDFVLWVDADAMIVDFTRDMVDSCPRDGHLFVVEHHYDDQRIPNMGVFAARSTRQASDFLDLVWAQERYIDHDWWENAATLDLLGYRLWPCGPERPSPYSDLVRFIGNEWNSITQDPSQHPVIKHYAGKGHEERLAAMRADLASVERLLPR